MTDNEIIRAYEICNSCSCVGCPLEFAGGGCGKILKDKVLDLIMRQQTEIERLNSLCTSQEAEIEKLKNSPIIGSLCPMWKAEARVETIKEFADRLFRKSQHLASSVYGTPERGVFLEDIDALVIEMTGKEI